jgi:hypothetical protein
MLGERLFLTRTMSELRIVTAGKRTPMDEDIAELAQWLGLDVRWQGTLDPTATGLYKGASTTVTATSADSLIALAGSTGVENVLTRLTTGANQSLLVYSVTDSPAHAPIVSWSCGTTTQAVQLPQRAPTEDRRVYAFAPAARPWVGPLCAQAFERSEAGAADEFSLEGSLRSEAMPLMTVSGQPQFVRSRTSGGGSCWIWLRTRAVRVSEELPRGVDLPDLYERVLPALIFLKAVFGAQCWHNPRHKARLVIDDCLLHDRFGFISYDELVKSMKRARYATTIAYIPWNYRRAHRPVVEVFKRESNLLGLCVHGCDHTSGEFASVDETDLARRSELALARMRQMQQSTALSIDPVMVFPQGRFSPAALRSLRRAGYLAAVNSETRPCSDDDAGYVTLGELMLPASTRYAGFAILPRQYPKRLVDFAVDLFLGRAALIVEHHEFVRHGYEQWEAFVHGLNSLSPNLEWTGLEEIANDCHLQRNTSAGHVEVWSFCSNAQWRNDRGTPVHVCWSKHEPEPGVVREIRVNGCAVPFSWDRGQLHFRTVAPALAALSVEFVDSSVAPVQRQRSTFAYAASVFARRHVSELRLKWQSRGSQRYNGN